MVLPENDHATSFHMKTRQVLIPVSVSPSATLQACQKFVKQILSNFNHFIVNFIINVLIKNLKSMIGASVAVRERVNGDIYSILDVIKTISNYECVINCNCGNKSARTSCYLL